MWKSIGIVIGLGMTTTLGLFSQAIAGWSPEGVSICEEPGDQVGSRLTTDCDGGAIIVWQDARTDTLGVYAQRLLPGGSVQWSSGGVRVVAAGGDSLHPDTASDGNGGAYIVWHDARATHYNIYAQHVDSSGVLLWGAGGIAACEAMGDQVEARVVEDDAGGAIIVWSDGRGSFEQLYGQRLDANGVVKWPVDGLPLCHKTIGDQGEHKMIADGKGGVIVTWRDWRAEPVEEGDIYVQRLTAAGTQAWDSLGVAVCVATDEQRYPELVSDGDGGAIITWADYRDGLQGDIYAQRIRESGDVPSGGLHVWSSDGIAVCDYTGKQRTPKIASDGVGGAIITWMDNRADPKEYDIFATRIDEYGSIVWPDVDGTPIDLAYGVEQKLPHVVSDGEGGGLIIWREGDPGSYDLYAKRVPADGTPPSSDTTWGVERYELCTYGGSQLRPQYLPTGVLPAGIGGAIVVWEDRRNEEETGCDVFASMLPRISETAIDQESGPAHPVRLIGTYPNPFNPRTRIVLRIDETVPVRMAIYDLAGRRIRVLLHEPSVEPGLLEIDWDGRNWCGAQVAAGAYFCRLEAGAWSETKRMLLMK